MINQINVKKPVKKAKLPLTQAEDELVIASRMVKEKNKTSNVSAVNKDFLDGSVIRETIGLKARESTHANVAV